MTAEPLKADLLLSGATLITMDSERRVITDGAVAIAGDKIVAVGKREALARSVNAKEVFDARRFVITPGFIDMHIHITGDPITRGFRARRTRRQLVRQIAALGHSDFPGPDRQ